MKRLFYFAITTLFVAAAVLSHVSIVAAAEDNLIPNPSMELPSGGNTDTPESWSKGGWGTNTATLTYDTSGHTGSRSAKVQITSYTDGDAKWYFTPQEVTAGTKYNYSDYYKSTTTSSLVAQFENSNGEYSYAAIGDMATSANWTQATTSFTIPSNMTKVTVFHLISSVGSLNIDDTTLTGTVASSPVVTITAPTANATVSNTTDITASASDTSGIVGVQFKVDGTNIGTEITAAPYQLSWNTASLSNGQHTITATARNTQGISTQSESVIVTVNNTQSGNLIANSSLEISDPANSRQPDRWQSSNWGTNTTAFSYIASGTHTGSHAVQTKITSYTDGDAKWYFNPVAVTPGSQYRFSDYYKATVATEVVAAFTMPDGSTSYETVGLPDASTNWTSFSTTFTIPLGAVDMTVFHLIAHEGTLTIDDTSLTPYTPVGFNRALVSLTFDDGYAGTYANGLPLLNKYGFTSTQFIISSLVGTPNYMTKAQIKAFSAAGHEIGSHSVTHPDMTTLTKAKYDQELANSKTNLEKWFGVPVTNFAFPEGRYNQAIVNAAKSLYSSTRSVEAGLNSKDNFNAYDIKVQNVDMTTTSEQFSDWIAEAQATNTWLVLVYHAVTNDGSGDYSITTAMLDSQLALIKNKAIPVVTMQQALAELTPQH
jgi:peptidoglycan/xylan/chitin deacetylase (PgdA/CDA1 family)